MLMPRPKRSARCLAAPTTSRSPPTAPAPPHTSISGAARACTSPAVRDTISRLFCRRVGQVGLVGRVGAGGDRLPLGLAFPHPPDLPTCPTCLLRTHHD